ncbi:MAG: elongation factor 1-beta [Candidatus Hydrothermarchaeales archaeon]
MADVLVTFKVMPEEAGMDMDKLVGVILNLDGVKVNDVKKTPIAFGLVALEPSFIVEDEEGATNALEEKLKGIEGIREVEVSEVTLV